MEGSETCLWFLGPSRVQAPNGISIGSSVYAGLTFVDMATALGRQDDVGDGANRLPTPASIPASTRYSVHTHTHTHPFNGPLSGTTRVSRYQKCKTNLDFTEARDSEWQWHQPGHMQVRTSLQTDKR